MPAPGLHKELTRIAHQAAVFTRALKTRTRRLITSLQSLENAKNTYTWTAEPTTASQEENHEEH